MTGMSDETGPLGAKKGAGKGRGSRGGGLGRGRRCRRGWRHKASTFDRASGEQTHSALKKGQGRDPTASTVVGPSPKQSEWHQVRQQLDWLQNEVGAVQERIHQVEISASKPPGSGGSAAA